MSGTLLRLSGWCLLKYLLPSQTLHIGFCCQQQCPAQILLPPKCLSSLVCQIISSPETLTQRRGKNKSLLVHPSHLQFSKQSICRTWVRYHFPLVLLVLETELCSQPSPLAPFLLARRTPVLQLPLNFTLHSKELLAAKELPGVNSNRKNTGFNCKMGKSSLYPACSLLRVLEVGRKWTCRLESRSSPPWRSDTHEQEVLSRINIWEGMWVSTGGEKDSESFRSTLKHTQNFSGSDVINQVMTRYREDHTELNHPSSPSATIACFSLSTRYNRSLKEIYSFWNKFCKAKQYAVYDYAFCFAHYNTGRFKSQGCVFISLEPGNSPILLVSVINVLYIV